MLDRTSCERRVYRLASLLTGNPIAAAKVIAQVLDAQPDLRNLDSAHMDRLTVLRAREIRPGTLVDDRLTPKFAQALGSLNPQQREAWVFAFIYQMPAREVSKAMDCSVTATQRHIDQADLAMQKALGDAAECGLAAKQLREYSMGLEVPAFYRQRQRQRKVIRLMAWIAAVVMIAALMIGLWLWLQSAIFTNTTPTPASTPEPTASSTPASTPASPDS